MAIRKCAHCGKVYKPQNEAHNYCSVMCLEAAYNHDVKFSEKAKYRLIGIKVKEG